MQAQASRTLSMSYAEVGRMGYGEALLALMRYAKLDQDHLDALRSNT